MSDPSLPPFIGRYRVDALLGRGAMGVVYKGHDPAIDRPVALKLIRADLLGGQDAADYVARFRREAQAAGRCQHPNIVAVYDFAEHEGNPFIAMEYLEGTALQAAIDQGTRFGAADAIFLILQVLDALACAHGFGIVHRDIKPANILLLQGGRVKVADFGVARLDSSDLTQNGSAIGTPSYMSPEQCRGDPIDARSDLFSAGVVLFELLAGEKPFPGKTFTEVVYKLLTQEPPAIAGRVPDLPAAVERVLLRALAKDPQRRFATARDMAEALRGATADAGDPADRTIVVPAGAPDPAAAPVPWGRETVETLERKLADHIGPIAKLVVGRAVKEARDLDSLCDTIGRSLPASVDRQNFLHELRAMCRTVPEGAGEAAALASGVRGGQPLLQEPELAAIERALAHHIGPIARIVLKRELARAHSAADLCERLTGHIEPAAERAAFRAAVSRWL